MDLVFSTDQHARSKRYNAWQAAICDFYVHVDVNATRPEDYRGYIRESKFGEVVLTDILVSEQTIRRDPHHISRLDKDCYYLQLLHYSNLRVVQRGETYHSNPARGAIFCATEQYELQCLGEARSFYLELPRDEFAQRFPREKIPVAATINTTRGLGRIATEFCNSLAVEDARIDPASRAQLGSQLMDLLASMLTSESQDAFSGERSVQAMRLRSVQSWIEARLSEPNLTLERIAAANSISLRYLHVLFQQCDMSVSEWIWHRRLQLCYDKIASGECRSITNIAYDQGFNSSAHFSTAFRRKFGISPRELQRMGDIPKI